MPSKAKSLVRLYGHIIEPGKHLKIANPMLDILNYTGNKIGAYLESLNANMDPNGHPLEVTAVVKIISDPETMKTAVLCITSAEGAIGTLEHFNAHTIEELLTDANPMMRAMASAVVERAKMLKS